MSNVAFSGNALGTGTFTIASPNSNTDRTINLPDSSGTVLLTPTNALNINANTPANTVVTDAAGNVGLGAAPSAWGSSFKALQINGVAYNTQWSNSYYIGINSFHNGSGWRFIANGHAPIYEQNIATGGHIWYVSNSGTAGGTPSYSTAMTIDASGRLIVGAETLYITNIPTTSTAGNCLISSGEGNKFYRSTSSLKYKRNVVDMQRGVQDVMRLRPVNFNGVSDFDGNKLFAGFIAEEIEALGLKEFVIYDDKGEPDGLQYANMVALLAKAIQEQQTTIAALTDRIAALEGTPNGGTE